MAPLRYAAKFDPFLSLDYTPTPSILAQSKGRKGSNFAIWQPCRNKRSAAAKAGAEKVKRRRRGRRQISNRNYYSSSDDADGEMSEQNNSSQEQSTVIYLTLGGMYRGPKNGLYVVARNLFLLLLICSARPCLGPA